MTAVVKYEGNLREEFQVRNGLRQGCVLAPILFNIYINCVMREWREKVKDTGIRFKYDMTKSLVGGYQKKNAPDVMVMELQFADDSALLTETRESAEAAIQNFASIAANYGLTVSYEKTKLMTYGPKLCVEDAGDIDIGIPSCSVQHVKQFKYLGSIVSDDLSLDLDITERIAQAGKCFGALKEAVFQSPHVTYETKMCCFSQLSYQFYCMGHLLGP